MPEWDGLGSCSCKPWHSEGRIGLEGLRELLDSDSSQEWFSDVFILGILA